MRNFLVELSRWLGQGEIAAGVGPDSPPALRRQFFDDVAGQVLPRLNDFYQALEREAVAMGPDDAQVHRAITQRELHPLLLCSPFVHRAYTKPLGYAGDYEMVNMMLRDPAEGQTSYAQIINFFNLEQGPSRAHRNRIAILEQRLASEAERVCTAGAELRVLNIGCGPAHELRRFALHPLARRCRFDLLDFNAETLEQCRRGLEAAAPAGQRPEAQYIHKSIHVLLKEALARSVQPPTYDVVYCAGLFDYLSDKICLRLVRMFWELCQPGGLVLCTNVHSANPSRGMMDFVLEWHLVHRDESGMEALVPAGASSEVWTDATGVNVFMALRKPRL